MDSSSQFSDVKRFLRQKVRTDIVAEYDQMIDEMPDDIQSFEEVEKLLRKGTIKIAGKFLQCWIEVAKKILDVPCCPKCGKKMRHRGLRECTIMTTVGEVKYKRPRFRCDDCGESLYPHDATVRFLAHGVSQSLAQVIARMGADRPFEQAVEYLDEDYYIHLTKQTVQQVTENAGNHIIEQEDERRKTIKEMMPGERVNALAYSSPVKHEIAAVTCDGTMVHTREKPGYLGGISEDRPEWHEVRVGNVSVGNIEVKNEKLSDMKRGNHFSMDVSYSDTFARFESVEDVGIDLYMSAKQAGFFDANLRCFISDGASWLRTIAETHFHDAVHILDWYHATEYISELSNEMFGKESKDAKRWTEGRETELWNGDVGAVICAIEELYKITSLTGSQRKMIDKTLTYIRNNRDRMRYPEYRELGLPIGSGRIEGLCKSLVGDRCKASGMRGWTIRGSEGVLRIRAARRDGKYKETWQKHFASA